MTTTHFEIMRFPGEGINGGWAYNVKISHNQSYWVSPLVKLDIIDEEIAREEIQRQVAALRESMRDA